MPNPLKMLKLKQNAFQFIMETPIAASPATVWKSLVKVESWWKYPMIAGAAMKLEPRAGGRFYEAAKGGFEALHGIVMYAAPGKLLRINGSMGLSHLPMTNAIIFELQSQGKGTLLWLGHRGAGLMTAGIEKQFKHGWKELIAELKKFAEK